MGLLQKMVQPRQATFGKRSLPPALQLKPQQQQQMHHPGPTPTTPRTQHVFLQSCSPAGSNSFRSIDDIDACDVNCQLPDGSLRDEKESPVEYLQGRITSPKLQYREAGVQRRQSGPSR